jgi:hypothetical protein
MTRGEESRWVEMGPTMRLAIEYTVPLNDPDRSRSRPRQLSSVSHVGRSPLREHQPE